ncbi:MAG: OmpH family outer membrane protein [Acidobacteriota bacterium]|nr:OmpH family outer membrane protein [Acidobacteriota bacterium]
MRVWCIAVGLSLGLTAAPAFAQTTAPAQKPAPPAAQPAKPEPPRPFPEGAKVAYIDIQRIAAQSAAGRASSAKVQALVQKKQAEAAVRAKALQEKQQKLQQSGSVMSEAARDKLQQEVEQDQIDAQRFQQDAQRDVQNLQQELQQDFEKKLMPVIEAVVHEKGVQVLLSRGDAGIVWANPDLDLTDEVIRKLDAATEKPATPKGGVR